MMQIKQVVVLTPNKFDNRDFVRFGVSVLLEKGYSVDVLDLSEWLRSKHYCATYNPTTEIREGYVKKINGGNELKTELRKYDLPFLFALCFLPLYPDTKEVFQIVSDLNIPYAVFRLGTLPTPTSTARILAGRLKYYLVYNILSSKINAASAAFMAGRKSRFELGAKIDRFTKIINIGSTDYNTFTKLEDSAQRAGIDYPEIVFIDVAYPSHPDDEGWQFLNAQIYYVQVNSFLRKYVDNFGMSCGVAVHPRTSALESNPYDFPIFRNRTPELIKNAKIIIAHYSTSLSYAVLYYRPIVFIGVKSIENLVYGKYEKKFAKELGLKIHYIDAENKIDEPTLVDKRKYDAYIENYIIDKSRVLQHPDLPSALLSYLDSFKAANV